MPIAVTAAYVCAFALSYVLNRTFNFQSHAPVGPQVAIYVVVVVVNYLASILGVRTSALAIEAGERSRRKRIHVRGLTADAVRSRLDAVLSVDRSKGHS